MKRGLDTHNNLLMLRIFVCFLSVVTAIANPERYETKRHSIVAEERDAAIAIQATRTQCKTCFVCFLCLFLLMLHVVVAMFLLSIIRITWKQQRWHILFH